MTRRRVLLALGVGLAVLVAAGAAWWLMPCGPYIDEAHVDRIKLGMRPEEVEAILGGPPGQYEGARCQAPMERPPGTMFLLVWDGPGGTVLVDFGGDGVVVDKLFNPRPQLSLLEEWIGAVRRLFP